MWNNGGAQMTAAIAMGVVVIAVAFSVQRGSVLKDLIAGFGSAGQVFFAGMVWKLSREQFRFTQNVSDRQKQIDLLPLREAAFGDLRKSFRAINIVTIDTKYVIAVEDSLTRLEPLFSQKVLMMGQDYVDRLFVLRSANKEHEVALGNFAKPDDRQLLWTKRANAYSDVRNCWERLSAAAAAETKLA